MDRRYQVAGFRLEFKERTGLQLGVHRREVAKCPFKIDWLILLFDFEPLCSKGAHDEDCFLDCLVFRYFVYLSPNH